ncbi:type II CAAX endopeptidase family protein [Flavihumibacter sp. CACIAM 22H1]|uniref:CPBP family intramembrane glutamic endopeptidase n=1 Tax=Flavihumibacter sp. CACIAM 22H1 TaxID=1812911 RepID=UPI0007A884C2|nr:type II CAAX endopeptidase family protein [Flavihumibacter sp. CACIAM 22H1]KYP14891.1 MAG: hypothetical protein A1D16_07825 [Flavihumibacter sp. CACIAM 22H1]
MAKQVIDKPWNLPGYVRVIVYTLLFLGVLIGGGTIGALLGFDVYLTTTLMAVLTGLLTYFLRIYLDRESWVSLGWEWKGFQKDCIVGLLVALAILGSGSCILLLMNAIEWAEVQWNGQAFWLSLGLMLLVAFYEELAFRGYILNNLMKSLHPFTALLLSAMIFALFHGTNPNASVLSILNVFLAGLLLGINFIFTRNLWFGIGLHFSWNFIQGPVLGYEVSGLSLPSILVQQQTGADILTGGNFGFEGSIINTALMLLTILVLLAVYTKQFQKKWLL